RHRERGKDDRSEAPREVAPLDARRVPHEVGQQPGARAAPREPEPERLPRAVAGRRGAADRVLHEGVPAREELEVVLLEGLVAVEAPPRVAVARDRRLAAREPEAEALADARRRAVVLLGLEVEGPRDRPREERAEALLREV